MYNPYIVVPFATWIIAQTIKFCLAAWQGKLDFKYLYASGGMPSVHSAVVCSLAVTSLLVDGPGSHLFGFILLFAAIVMYDSFGVRRSTGEQAVAINMIMASLEGDRIKIQEHTKLREVLGHKPAEVMVGALLGVALGGLFNSTHLTAEITFLTAEPVKPEILAYAVGFGALVVIGLVARVILARKYSESKVMGRLNRQLLLISQTIGWLGLVAAFGQFQRLPYLSGRIWSWLIIAAFILWAVWIVAKFSAIIPVALLEEKEHQRKQKWFGKKTKKRK